MSSATLRQISSRIREIGVEAAWKQWGRLGASGLQDFRERPASIPSIIDPETLLLFSLYFRRVEKRLADFIYWWADVGSELLSVQRAKTLLKDFPPETEKHLAFFACQAVEAGDKRWRRYASDEATAHAARKGKGADRPRLNAPSALVLRLRAGFGVSAKADVLAYLLGTAKSSSTRQETADAVAYSRATVRGALRDMARAGFIEETREKPVRYYAPARAWSELLKLDARGSGGARGLPAWRYWAGVFAFLTRLDQWAQKADERSDYLLSSRARTIFEDHASAFESNRIEVPRPEDYRGADYLEGIEETVEILSQWITERL